MNGIGQINSNISMNTCKKGQKLSKGQKQISAIKPACFEYLYKLNALTKKLAAKEAQREKNPGPRRHPFIAAA